MEDPGPDRSVFLWHLRVSREQGDRLEAVRAGWTDAWADRIARLRRAEDRQVRCAGRLLLRHALRTTADLDLEAVRWEPGNRGRPGLVADWDFNLSHSGRDVLLALVPQGRVGVDIERIRPVRTDDFRNVLSPDQLRRARSAPDPHEAILAQWTRLESILKADGRGLELTGKDLSWETDRASTGDNWYFFRSLDGVEGCVAAIARNTRIGICEWMEVDFRELAC